MKLKDVMESVKPDLGKVAIKVGQVATNPNALTAGTVVGIFGTTGLAIRATFKASADIEKEKKDGNELDIFDKLRLVSKYYVGTAISAFATAGMAIGSNRASAKQTAIVASSCALLQEAAENAQKKLEVSERKNEEKTEQLHKAVLFETPPDKKMWCKDLQTGCMFKTNKEILDNADGQIRERFTQDRSTTINDLYSMLGIDRIEIGDDYVIAETNQLHPLDVTPWFCDDGSVMLRLSYFQESLVGGYTYN